MLNSWIGKNKKFDLNKIEFNKINLKKLQKNDWFLIQVIQDWGFHGPTLGIGPEAKQGYQF